jgi:internalin A
MAAKQNSVWGWLTGRKLSIHCNVSYAGAHGKRYARALSDFLVEFGATVWLRADSPPGRELATIQGLREQISSATVVIVVVTPDAIISEAVRFEIEFATQRGAPILLIRFDDDAPEFLPAHFARQFWLRETADEFTGPSEALKSSLRSALTRLSKVVERDTVAQPPKPAQIPTRPLNEGKLILVGRGEVGKTSLVRGLVDGTFKGDESKTQGINITPCFFMHNRETFRLNVWDFGGQEIMHATHQFFLTERSVYLLVLNGREGGEDLDAEYWLKHIEGFGGNSPIIVVQNKIAQHAFDLNYRGLQARYPQIRGFIKTDCRDKIGLKDLRNLMETVVLGMPEVRMQFPSDWFAVKTKLEAMEGEYMSYERFVELCSEAGVNDDADRDDLRWVLHCLGIALNYRDDSRLRETSVLKAEWVTQGIYAILNAKTLADSHGELHVEDLKQLLPKNRYPVEKHSFLLELMRKFSLCFAFHEDADRYLVPDLLGKEEPEEASTFQPIECLNFEYHYGVLPEGLLPRFIVRTHTLSRDQKRWRTGVILAYEDCKALVTAEPAARRVIIRIKGGDAGARRRLLAIIRYDLDRISAEFKDRLEAQQMVPLAEDPTVAIDYKKLVAFERQGVKEFPEVVRQQVMVVKVNELLNGVDLEAERHRTLDLTNRQISVFFSYSHRDEALRDELETHLKLLQRERIIATWHDRKIMPGSDWGREIDSRLDRASIILLLVSVDFIASDYIWDIEMKRALQRHDAGEATVVPVLLRSCYWETAPFGRLQGLPRNMTAVTAWADRDAAWTDVALGIRAIAERTRPSLGWPGR